MTEHTSNWLQFLQRHGARLSDAEQPEVIGFEEQGEHAGALPEFVAPLAGLGLIAADGEDAPSFLHNQLTNDIEHLSEKQACLAGYCTPKGRLLATMLAWKSDRRVMLQLPRPIQPAIQKRLQMFVLRAKVKLSDESGSRVALGLAGHAAQSALAQWFPTLPAAPYEKLDAASGTLIRMPDAGGMPRYQWIAGLEAAQQAWPALSAAMRPAAEHAWRLTEIRAGIPQIAQATQEQFVPQMVNFDLVGGVNFKKGCYPGQEIVARTQYLGKLKRRMMLARVAAPNAKAGDEVFSDADPQQPCGMIVNAAPVSADEAMCLVEIKLAALAGPAVRLGSPQGPALQFEPPPYSVPDLA